MYRGFNLLYQIMQNQLWNLMEVKVLDTFLIWQNYNPLPIIKKLEDHLL
jgi:hypothetical protein